MPAPWYGSGRDEYEHNVIDEDANIVECRDCGKIATDPEKLKLTQCKNGKE
jgi:uncharacterized Zn finger protein